MIESTKFPWLILDLMDGTKVVFEYGLNILNRKNTFCCLKELLYHHLAFLHSVIVVQNNLPMDPRERLPLTAPEIPNSKPNVNLQHGRFFIINEELELGINVICFQFWKIQSFAKFAPHIYQ